MHDAYIGIGSNLGNREDNCRAAVRFISELGSEVVASSSMYETDPWGVEDQPPFINMVIRIKTELEPLILLKHLKQIEKKMGRKQNSRWGPRLIDLDILLYDDLHIDEPDLQIPHPYMFERDFVLKPLSEIAPDVVRKYRPPKTGD